MKKLDLSKIEFEGNVAEQLASNYEIEITSKLTVDSLVYNFVAEIKNTIVEKEQKKLDQIYKELDTLDVEYYQLKNQRQTAAIKKEIKKKEKQMDKLETKRNKLEVKMYSNNPTRLEKYLERNIEVHYEVKDNSYGIIFTAKPGAEEIFEKIRHAQIKYEFSRDKI